MVWNYHNFTAMVVDVDFKITISMNEQPLILKKVLQKECVSKYISPTKVSNSCPEQNLFRHVWPAVYTVSVIRFIGIPTLFMLDVIYIFQVWRLANEIHTGWRYNQDVFSKLVNPYEHFGNFCNHIANHVSQWRD